MKREASSASRSDSVLELNRGELLDSISNVVRDLRGLPVEVSSQGDKLRDWIDDKLRNDLRRFADARESMVHLFGLQAYADIMSSFAAAERYLNRVWSASVDGYIDECHAYIGHSRAQFEAAEAKLSSLRAT